MNERGCILDVDAAGSIGSGPDRRRNNLPLLANARRSFRRLVDPLIDNQRFSTRKRAAMALSFESRSLALAHPMLEHCVRCLRRNIEMGGDVSDARPAMRR